MNKKIEFTQVWQCNRNIQIIGIAKVKIDGSNRVDLRYFECWDDFKFTEITESHSDSFIRMTRLSRVIPALLTRISILLNFSSPVLISSSAS